MPSGGCHLQCPLGDLVAGYIDEIRLVGRHLPAAAIHRPEALPLQVAQAPQARRLEPLYGDEPLGPAAAHQLASLVAGAQAVGQKPRHRPHPPV